MTNKPQETENNRHSPVLAGLVLTVCFVAGLGTGALLWRGDENAKQAAVDANQQVQLVSNGYKAADLLLVAADNLAKERGLTYAALKSTGHVPADARDDIEQARDRADRELTQALGLMSDQLAFNPNSSFMKRVSRNQKSLKQMRAEVDDLTSSQDPTVNAARANKWFAQSSRLLKSEEQLMELVHSKIRSVGIDIDSAVALKLQRLAIIMIDFVGRERGIVSGAIEEKRKLDESVSGWLLPAYRGRIGGIWTSVNAAANSNTLSPKITSLIAKVQGEYFNDMEPLRDRIQKASDAGEPYPITAEEWFAKATGVINSIVSLGQEAGQFAQSRSEKPKQSV